MIAHVAGVPVEELLPAVVSTAGTSLMVVRARVMVRKRRRKEATR